MEDSPCIKHILKTSLLEDEVKSPPSKPADIPTQCACPAPTFSPLLSFMRATLTLCLRAPQKTGKPPSTSGATNLVFVLAHRTGVRSLSVSFICSMCGAEPRRAAPANRPDALSRQAQLS